MYLFPLLSAVQGRKATYRLRYFICHEGTVPFCGHYTAYTLMSGVWIMISDSTVRAQDWCEFYPTRVCAGGVKRLLLSVCPWIIQYWRGCETAACADSMRRIREAVIATSTSTSIDVTQLYVCRLNRRAVVVLILDGTEDGEQVFR